jgi:hypothetical protein
MMGIWPMGYKVPRKAGAAVRVSGSIAAVSALIIKWVNRSAPTPNRRKYPGAC